MQVDEGPKGKETNAFEIRVRFQRDGGGYRMWTKVELPGAPAALMSQAPMKVLLRPIEFRVSAEGEVTGIVDEAGYWRALDTIIGSFAKAAEPNASDRQLYLDIYRSMRRLPDEERVTLLSRNVAPLLGFCGVEAEIGASWTVGREEVGLPFPGTPKVIRERQVSLKSATAESAYFHVTSSIERDSFKRAIDAMIASVPAKEGRPPPPQTLPDIIQTAEASVSSKSGLTTFYEEVHRAAGAEAGGTASKKVTLRLVR